MQVNLTFAHRLFFRLVVALSSSLSMFSLARLRLFHSSVSKLFVKPELFRQGRHHTLRRNQTTLSGPSRLRGLHTVALLVPGITASIFVGAWLQQRLSATSGLTSKWPRHKPAYAEEREIHRVPSKLKTFELNAG